MDGDHSNGKGAALDEEFTDYLVANKLTPLNLFIYMDEHMSRAFDPVQLGSIELFCKAAELGSFTATAQVLGVTPASVSRSIQRIEARLGVKLFNRTTRSVRLTEDGELYRAQCQQALDQIAEAERALTGRQRHPKGLLRVSVGTVYAHHRLVPLLPGFMAAYPEIELELNVSNRNIDFVEDGYDLAIRLGEPRDSRVIARKLEEASVGVFCSPDYAARRPPPTSLDALHQHDLIQFITPSTGRPFPWSFIDDKGLPVEVSVHSRQRVLEDVLAGLGWRGSVPDLPFRGGRGAPPRQAGGSHGAFCGAIPPLLRPLSPAPPPLCPGACLRGLPAGGGAPLRQGHRLTAGGQAPRSSSPCTRCGVHGLRAPTRRTIGSFPYCAYP